MEVGSSVYMLCECVIEIVASFYMTMWSIRKDMGSGYVGMYVNVYGHLFRPVAILMLCTH